MIRLEGADRQFGWLEPLLFVGTLAAATFLYMATHEPLLAVVLPCLHGGWHSFRTGLWLLRSDPCRPRARTCFAFYLASACLNSAAFALSSLGLFGAGEVGMGHPANIKELNATLLVLAGGVLLNSCIGLGAIYAALTRKIRVWVQPRLREMVRGDLTLVSTLRPLYEDLTPVTSFGPAKHRFNHAVLVVATSLVFPVVGAGILAVIAMTVGKDPVQVTTTPIMTFEFAALFGAPLAMIPCYAWVSSRIIARSPRECWPAWTLGGGATDSPHEEM